jgi:hypothetical protein
LEALKVVPLGKHRDVAAFHVETRLFRLGKIKQIRMGERKHDLKCIRKKQGRFEQPCFPQVDQA